MRIRLFAPSDAAALAQLFHDTVHRIAGQHYSAEQVKAWVPNVPDPQRFLDWGSDGRLFLVAAGDEDEPLAFGDLEHDGHIDHLFCRADLAGTGVTAALYDALEEAACNREVERLYVEASEPARRFFLRKGFHVDHRRDFSIGGVPIHNYRMEKRIR